MTNKGNGSVKVAMVRSSAYLWLAVASLLGGCVTEGTSDVELQQKQSALGNAGGAQACVVGTASLRLASRVTVAGGVAANSLTIDSGSVVNGGANILLPNNSRDDKTSSGIGTTTLFSGRFEGWR
jgi:hypothetical protein